MKYLGIDYGSKRIGLALSDEEGKMAFPHSVLENNAELLPKIKEIVAEKNVGAVVMGESKDFQGKDNEIMEGIRKFASVLEEEIKIKIFFEPEFLTSHQAQKIQGKNELLDASAAAIILQSFLDRTSS